MYEFEIWNKATDEKRFVFGYSYQDAMKRAGLNAEEWIILFREYID